jgi:hypothetical protein
VRAGGEAALCPAGGGARLVGDDARVYVTEFEARRAALLKIARMLARKINLENDRHPKWVFYQLTV